MISMESNVQQILRKQHYANLCDYILVFKPPLKLLTCHRRSNSFGLLISSILFFPFPESLEKNGISVWVDVVGLGAGVDFLSKIGQAILEAKVLHVFLNLQYLSNIIFSKFL